MPDHLHVLLTPAPEVSLEKSMQFIKGGFSFHLKSKLDVWQRGFNESRIRDAKKFNECKRYIEENSLQTGLVGQSELYAFSSAGREELVDRRPDWLMARG